MPCGASVVKRLASSAGGDRCISRWGSLWGRQLDLVGDDVTGCVRDHVRGNIVVSAERAVDYECRKQRCRELRLGQRV
jgi:hypothetical protein